MLFLKSMQLKLHFKSNFNFSTSSNSHHQVIWLPFRDSLEPSDLFSYSCNTEVLHSSKGSFWLCGLSVRTWGSSNKSQSFEPIRSHSNDSLETNSVVLVVAISGFGAIPRQVSGITAVVALSQILLFSLAVSGQVTSLTAMVTLSQVARFAIPLQVTSLSTVVAGIYKNVTCKMYLLC